MISLVPSCASLGCCLGDACLGQQQQKKKGYMHLCDGSTGVRRVMRLGATTSVLKGQWSRHVGTASPCRSPRANIASECDQQRSRQTGQSGAVGQKGKHALVRWLVWFLETFLEILAYYTTLHYTSGDGDRQLSFWVGPIMVA